jgi:hypothetical protein
VATIGGTYHTGPRSGLDSGLPVHRSTGAGHTPQVEAGYTSQWQCYPDPPRLGPPPYRGITHTSEGVTSVNQGSRCQDDRTASPFGVCRPSAVCGPRATIPASTVAGQFQGVHMANGVAEILPNQPFTVRVVNTSTKARRLPKRMVLGHALPHPTAMVALIEDLDVSEDPNEGDNEHARKELSPMEHGLKRDPPPLPDRPDVEGDTWKEAVQLGQLPTADRAEILGMLEKHRSMWNGKLVQVHSTAHRIDFLPGQKPVQCQPYRAGPKSWAL